MEKLDLGCIIKADGSRRGPCKHTRRYMQLAPVPIPGTWTPVIHYNCIGNQLVSVTNRVLGVVPRPDLAAIQELETMARTLGQRLPKIVPQPLGKFAEQYSGAKRARYLAAAELVKTYGLRPKDAQVTMFVKPDRINPAEKINPDPRAIQFRDAKYCVALAAYLKPIEPHLYNLKFKAPNLGYSRLIAKGLNQYQRASTLKKKWARYSCPVAFSIDASRFDKHVLEALLHCEHLVYLQCNNDPEFAALLRQQLANLGYSADGLIYLAAGRRMSGDMNTALGNCTLMILMCLCVYLKLGKPFDIFDDGDDCLIICELADRDLFANATSTMSRFGMTIKIENEATVFERIVFCQSQPVLTQRGWKFCRNPFKVMSNALVGQKWVHLNAKGRQTYLNGIAECEIILNKGIPVLHHFGEALRRNACTHKKAFDYSSGEYLRYIRELKCFKLVDEFVPITFEARISFERAFGITIEEQLQWEQRLDNWSFPLTGDRVEPMFYEASRWEDNRSFHAPCSY
jgi:hypothetical protein